MSDKILIFTSRHLCYNSADFFAMRLADGLEAAGIECECCCLEFEGDSLQGNGVAESSTGRLTQESQEKLERYLGKSYLAVIDFNSRMPHMILDDDSYYLDGIDAPFYDYILDHPLYHHGTLSCRLKNYNLIVLDDNQKKYVQQHYPWIKSVLFQPLGGQPAFISCALEDKNKEILFTGTYRNPDEIMGSIMQIEDTSVRSIILDIISCMKQKPDCTVEQALSKLVTVDEDFSLIMNKCYLAEVYMRNLYRKNLIDAFAKSSLPIRITGNWWEQYEYIGNENITLQAAVEFARSTDVIARSAIVLDSSPFFLYGIHDRVTAAIANKTVAFTDDNAYLHDIHDKGYNGIQTYLLNDPKKAVAQAEYLLNNFNARKEAAECAYEFYQKELTWERVAHNLLGHIIAENK